MDKNTYGHYGWLVIVVIIICILISGMPGLMAIFKVNIESTVTDFGDTMDNAWETPQDDRFESDPDPDHEKPAHGDTVEVGDYTYMYYSAAEAPSTYTISFEYFDGWYVFAKTQDKTAYGKICSEIYGEPVVGMMGTFQDCTLMEKSPVIPDSILIMVEAYTNCTSLSDTIEVPGGVTEFVFNFDSTVLPIKVMVPASAARISSISLPATEDNVTYVLSTPTFAWEGESFQNSSIKPSNGDEIVIGDYIYRYNEAFARNSVRWADTSSLTRANGTPYQAGWSVITTAYDKSSYGEICSTICGKPVVNLDHTYKYCSSITAMPNIPDSITTFGVSAFAYTKLVNITIPNNIVLIDEYAFQWCSKLTTVNVPSTVEYIASNAFADCEKLSVINFEATSAPEGFVAPVGVTVNYNVSM